MRMAHLHVFWWLVALPRKTRQCVSGGWTKWVVVGEWRILCKTKINARLHLNMDWMTLPGWGMVWNYMACWHMSHCVVARLQNPTTNGWSSFR